MTSQQWLPCSELVVELPRSRPMNLDGSRGWTTSNGERLFRLLVQEPAMRLCLALPCRAWHRLCVYVMQ